MPAPAARPPLWLACNRKEKIVEAARLGLGALNFSFGVKPELAQRYAEAYYAQVEAGMEPLGRAPNPNLAVVTGFMCAGDAAEARRGFQAMKFFMHAINYYFEPGRKMPERLDLHATFGDGSRVANVDPDDPTSLGSFGTPDQVRRDLEAYEASGVDQVILVAQAGGLDHVAIMDSLRRFGREVLPVFKQRDQAAMDCKRSRLAAAGVG